MTKPLIEELEFTFSSVTRDENLMKLLERLVQDDELIDYNVPAAIRSSYDNQALFHHLKQIYEQKYFVLDDPAQIRIYKRIGDRVIKKGLAKVEYSHLRQGETGVVEEVDGKYVIIQFDKQKSLWTLNLNDNDLTIEGRRSTIFTAQQRYNPPRSIKTTRIEKHHLVRYEGQDIIRYGAIIPDAAQGVIVDIWDRNETQKNKGQLFIIWLNQPRLLQEMDYHHPLYPLSTSPQVFWKYTDIKLVKQNWIDFAALCREYLKINDGVE